MTIRIDSLTPPRVRGSETLVIGGVGFDALPANNDVQLSLAPATVIAASPFSLTITLPLIFQIGASDNQHVDIRVENLVTGEVARSYVFIKPFTLAEQADNLLDSAIPGPFETPGAPERPRFFEAVDMERLVGLIDAVVQDVEPGNLIVGRGGGSGVGQPGGNVSSGQALKRDVIAPGGWRWSYEQDVMLPFGGSVLLGPVLLPADGDQLAATGSAVNVAPSGGRLDLVSALVKSPGGTLDLFEILVNGAPAFSLGPALGLGNNAVLTAAPALLLAAFDTVEIRATQIGAGPISVIGASRFVMD